MKISQRAGVVVKKRKGQDRAIFFKEEKDNMRKKCVCIFSLHSCHFKLYFHLVFFSCIYLFNLYPSIRKSKVIDILKKSRITIWICLHTIHAKDFEVV